MDIIYAVVLMAVAAAVGLATMLGAERIAELLVPRLVQTVESRGFDSDLGQASIKADVPAQYDVLDADLSRHSLGEAAQSAVIGRTRSYASFGLTKPVIAIDIRPALRRPYGVGLYIERTLFELAKQDTRHKYVLWSASLKDSIPSWVSELVHINSNFSAVHLRLPSKVMSWTAALTNLNQLRNLLGDVQVFHSNYLVERANGTLAITHVHDLNFLLHREFRHVSNPYELAAAHSAKSADKIITVSEESKRQIHGLLGVPESNIAIAYGGADPRVFRQLAKREQSETLQHLNLVPGEYFLYVGNLHERKNVVRMVEATVSLWKSGINLPLALAGVEESELSRLITPEQRLCIRPLGYTSEHQLVALYNGAIALVFASMYEGFGLPMIEAMRSGTPVITSRSHDDFGGALEEIAGTAAMLVDPLSVSEIADAMRTLATQPRQRQSLVDAGLARSEGFTWDRAARKVLDVYDEVLT